MMLDLNERREAEVIKLEHEFATLDTTLIRAIAADLDPLYNLEKLRETLSTLSLETQDDDYDGSFDPSGMGGHNISNGQDGTEESTTQSKNTSQQSEPLTKSSISGDESFGEEDGDRYQAYVAPMLHLEDSEKVEKLAVMFPGEPAARIEFLLQKSHGDFTRTMDTLLNQTFMASETPSKGVDGFLEERVFVNKKKSRREKDLKQAGRGQRLEIGTAVYKKPDAEIEGVPTKASKHSALRSPMKSSFTQDYATSNTVPSPYLSSSDASSAWQDYSRKGKSAHRSPQLGRFAGAAASYYHSEANARRQDYDTLSKGDADRLVASTATRSQIDLHGVTVDHATRIAVTHTRKWWDELDDEHKYKAHLRPSNEFRIITGIGNHSVGGVGKLGPAVSKRLLAEGWKVSIGRGYVCVTGPARSK